MRAPASRAVAYTRQQRLARRLLVEADEIEVHDRSQQPIRVTVTHAHRNQLALAADGVARNAEPHSAWQNADAKNAGDSTAIVRAPPAPRRASPARSSSPAACPTPARAREPASRLPRDPLRPRPIGAGVADEEVDRTGHPVIIAHSPGPAEQPRLSGLRRGSDRRRCTRSSRGVKAQKQTA